MPTVLPTRYDRPGMSLSKLLVLSLKDPEAETAKYVQVGKIKKTKSYRCDAVTVTANPNEKIRKHACAVYARDTSYKGTLSACKQIMVTCDCDRFMYMWEWALWNRGVAELLHGNGEPPDASNPSYKPRVCKHLLKTLHAIVVRNW